MLGNLTSGATTGTALLPDGLHSLAGLLPNNASVATIRSALYFPGAATTGPILVLTGWVVTGYLLIAADHLRHRSRTRPPAYKRIA